MNRPVLLALILVLVLANVYVYRALFAPLSVRVESLLVGPPDGGGSATLVLIPGGRAVLVNTGPDAGILRALGEALPPWERKLDALVLLSAKAGAMGGAPFVLERYHVGTLLRGNEQSTAAREAALAKAVNASHTRIQEIPPRAGLLLHYGSLSLSLSASTTPGTYALLN